MSLRRRSNIDLDCGKCVAAVIQSGYEIVGRLEVSAVSRQTNSDWRRLSGCLPRSGSAVCGGDPAVIPTRKRCGCTPATATGADANVWAAQWGNASRPGPYLIRAFPASPPRRRRRRRRSMSADWRRSSARGVCGCAGRDATAIV